MPFIPSPRLTNLGLFLAAVVAMAFALYLEHGVGLTPCPLCIFQRLAMIAVGLIALAAWAHGPGRTGLRLYAALTALAALAGVAVAGRHVWIQHLPPDQVPACGPDLSYMWEVFPLRDVVDMVLTGSGECAKIDWVFLNISLPGWTLAAFLGLLAVAVWQLVRRDA